MSYQRNIKARFEEALSTSPAVLLTGGRQKGKTTFVKEIGVEKGYHYVTFDDLSTLSAAKRDPKGFIEALPKPVIIDEVQRVPDIFFPIKKYIDSNRKPGIYILTGSANPLLINKVAESLVGRLETLTLYPLSQGELHDRKEDFITTAFNTEQLLLPENTISKEELYKRMIVGGYPLVQPLSASRGDAWFRGYVRDILIKDVQDLSNIEGLSELPNLLKLISYRAGHVLNVAELSRQFGLSAVTTHRYLALLEALFMVYFCKPWRASAEKRLVKSPKVYMIDSGMVSFLQGMTVERLLAEPLFTGHILENFVWQELTKQATWSNLYVDIYHFRTDTGVEVDIVLEDMMGRVVGIKLKNSDTVKGHDFKGLEYLQEKFGNKFVRGIIFYTGNDFVPFSKKLNALPFSSLWR